MRGFARLTYGRGIPGDASVYVNPDLVVALEVDEIPPDRNRFGVEQWPRRQTIVRINTGHPPGYIVVREGIDQVLVELERAREQRQVRP